jgi:ABC-type bacteriocin/lantibiotic exporter with double-glycine peptidase domain
LDFLENISVEIPGICYQSGVIRDELDYIMELSKSDHNDGETENTIKNGIVKVKDIHFAYKDGRKIFNGFSLELKPNIKTAIIGKSGSGKSTLMKLLMGFFNVDKGEILIDDVNIKDYSLNYLRKSISYVNQTTSLFNNTILYNITYGTDATEEETKKLIDNLKLWEVFKYVDYNLHKTVGSNGSNMSGGQKQIILILRALLNKNSKMIVMDEPTSALDSKNTKLFLDILSRIKNKTIIVITHDDILIEFVDKVIYLQN